ncbi:5-oxoprolinase subunit PxpB [Robbsia sp. Bb-Pol-6]|uniref:5-oxoprolinase subunit PxpB n=1 Tax=Robbsia betulipollinis TaxID=2981849 RepID=A0ABT3ZKP0_9BURK|nr:5-oxoprolinase subunit PxpB [Robbsia betulipollinis]MCY0387103.1 5-oxoprolinase subunit PxpB [Robbsia betulipollinis]
MPRPSNTAAPDAGAIPAAIPAAFPSVEPMGDRCLLVRLGTRIDSDVTQRVHALTARLFAARLLGVIDIVPAFTTVALHYRPACLPRAQGSPYAQLRQAIAPLLHAAPSADAAPARLIEIPVCYGGEYGPDLDDVARRCALSPEEVVRLHGAMEVSVHTFYFSPGNPFAGPLDPRLSVPRRTTPRTRVEAGSVAIANGLTSIYQVASPGGWNIIGRTPWSLFDLAWTPPTRLRLGDRLHFSPISPEVFAELDERRAR